MDRREFIAAIGFGLINVTPMIWAQQPAKVVRIGCILAGSRAAADAEGVTGALVAGLRSLGWIEGENLMMEYRSAENQNELLDKLARELVALKVDLIVTGGVNVVIAAKNATNSTPIVMVNAADPVKFGLVASLARPGANVTGSALPRSIGESGWNSRARAFPAHHASLSSAIRITGSMSTTSHRTRQRQSVSDCGCRCCRLSVRSSSMKRLSR